MFNALGTPEGVISLAVAKRRLPKEGTSYWITEVAWGNYTPKMKRCFLLSLQKEYELAIAPKLPKGYQMQTHDSWWTANSDLIKAAKNPNSFEHLEQVLQDCDYLEKVIDYGRIFNPYDLADFKPPEGFYCWSRRREVNKDLAVMTLATVVEKLPKPFHFQEVVIVKFKNRNQVEIDLDAPNIPIEVANTPISEIDSIELKIRSEIDEYKREWD